MAKIIEIDGAKLRTLLEESTGKTIRQISLDCGFSDSFLRMACKNNKATPAVQAVANLYGIAPSAYKAPDKVKRVESLPTKNGDQISIDDLESIKNDDLKAIIKEAVKEVIEKEIIDQDVLKFIIFESIDELLYNSEFALVQNPIDKTIRLLSRRIKEDKKCKRQ